MIIQIIYSQGNQILTQGTANFSNFYSYKKRNQFLVFMYSYVKIRIWYSHTKFNIRRIYLRKDKLSFDYMPQFVMTEYNLHYGKAIHILHEKTFYAERIALRTGN